MMQQLSKWALIGLTVLGLTASPLHAQNDNGQPAEHIYLSVVSNSVGPAGNEVTATPTPSPTPSASPTPSPTPDPNVVVATGEQCPTGMHLEHSSGFPGIVEADTFTPTVQGWGDYRCQVDQPATALTCSEHGVATVIDGVAVCSCAAGYGGAQCEIPLPPVATPAALLEGVAQALTAGAVVELQAKAPGVQAASSSAANGVWQVVQGEGCLLPSRDATACQSQLTGANVFFRAPAAVTALQATVVQFTPAAGGAPVQDTVFTQPPAAIPVNGYGRPQLAPILAALEQFMQDHCVGSGTIGIARYGQPVGVWGLGKVHGRAASDILNPNCPGDEVDPHYPQAPNITYDMPFPIGSVSKSVTYAVGRWALKERLQGVDTDLDIALLTADRLVSAQRTATGALQLDAWAINSAGVQGHLSSLTLEIARDLALTRVSATRLVAGLRLADNHLRLQVVDLDDQGQLVARGAGLADLIKEVALTSVAEDRVIAAVKNQADKLMLISYAVAADGKLTRTHHQVDNRVRDLAVVAVAGGPANGGRFVTAVRREDQQLQLKSWEVDAAGQITFARNATLPDRVLALKLARLGDTQVVVAVQGEDRSFKVMQVAVSATGLLDVVASDTAGVVGDFAVVARGPSGFAAAVRTQTGALKLINWVTDAGQLTRQGEASAGAIKGVALANQLYGSETPQAILFAAVRTAEDTLKLIPWDATGPTPQRLAADSSGAVIADYLWTDGDIEALYLTAYDLPEGLLPERLERYFSGRSPLPHFDPPLAGVTSVNDGTGATNSCEPLADYADAQWQQVQLKHVFAHRSGLPRSAPAHNDVVKDYLVELRDLTGPIHYAQQEALLRQQWGDASVAKGRAALGWSTAFQADGHAEGYLVPQATLDEILTVLAARCLPHPLGDYEYSNTDPVMLQQVIEHVTGREYAVAAGFPGTHEESALYHFFLAELGITTGQTNNIFAGTSALASASDNPTPGPTARGWNASASGTAQIYEMGWDRKRPHCVMHNGMTCDFDEWAAATNGRINWYWEREQVRLPYWSQGHGEATGGLRVEPLAYLKFMANYWISGYGTDPRIGEQRNNTWTPGGSHNGAGGGMYAEAMQFGGSAGCRSAVGVDVIVALNQSTDKTGADYNLNETIRAAVCAIDWTEVEPYPQFVLIGQ